MPAIAEPSAPIETPSIPQDGGFAERLNQAITADPNAARLPGAGIAPPPPEAPVAPKPADAPAGTEAGKKDPPEPPAPKAGAADMFKKLAQGEKPEEKPATPPTPEQKREYTMKELRLRAEKADSLEKELADVRKEIETAKAAGATPEQIKALTADRDAVKAERDDFKKKLEAADVMQSELYIKNVTEPLEAIWTDLKKASGDFKFSWEQFSNALAMQDHRQRLTAISRVLDSAVQENPESKEMESLDALNKQDIVNAVSEFVKRESYGQQILANSGKASEALKAEQARKTAEEKERHGQTFRDQSDRVFKQLFSDENLAQMPFLAPKGEDGRPVMDKALAAEIRKAATDDSADPWRHSLKSYALEVLPHALTHIEKQDAKIAEYEERIGKLSGAGPKPGGEIRLEDGSPDDKLTFEERIAKLSGRRM